MFYAYEQYIPNEKTYWLVHLKSVKKIYQKRIVFCTSIINLVAHYCLCRKKNIKVLQCINIINSTIIHFKVINMQLLIKCSSILLISTLLFDYLTISTRIYHNKQCAIIYLSLNIVHFSPLIMHYPISSNPIRFR